MQTGPQNLITDVGGLLVGHAQDEKLKSGTTVLTADTPFVAGVSVMGGAPGTRETDLLAPDKSVDAIDALVLSGGSAFGLDACGGVADALAKQGRGYAVGPVVVPIVPGAIIFDLINGGDKSWTKNPYAALGASALADASQTFDIGRAGAGFGAMSGDFMGGLGSASTVLADGTTVGAIVAVNAVGTATTPNARHFWAAPFEINEEFGGQGVDPRQGLSVEGPSRKAMAMGLAPDPRANTTIAIVATDAPLGKAQCQRMAVMAHDGMARALVPSHTPFDGDLVFGLSTGKGGEVDVGTLTMIGDAAAQTLARAIARGVSAATPYAGDLLPCWQDG